MTTEKAKHTPLRNWENPADKFVNQPGHWTMAKQYPHNCIHCGKGYNQHHPWPQLPCPDRKARGEQ